MRKKIQLMKHIQTNLLNNAQPSGQSNLAQEKKKKKHGVVDMKLSLNCYHRSVIVCPQSLNKELTYQERFRMGAFKIAFENCSESEPVLKLYSNFSQFESRFYKVVLRNRNCVSSIYNCCGSYRSTEIVPYI